jgi:hypothetical protein
MHIFAYVDPGMGALIWQSIIGIFVGMLFYLRKTRQWLGNLMRKCFRLGQKPAESQVDLPIDHEKLEADHL